MTDVATRTQEALCRLLRSQMGAVRPQWSLLRFTIVDRHHKRALCARCRWRATDACACALPLPPGRGRAAWCDCSSPPPPLLSVGGARPRMRARSSPRCSGVPRTHARTLIAALPMPLGSGGKRTVSPRCGQATEPEDGSGGFCGCVVMAYDLVKMFNQRFSSRQHLENFSDATKCCESSAGENP